MCLAAQSNVSEFRNRFRDIAGPPIREGSSESLECGPSDGPFLKGKNVNKEA